MEASPEWATSHEILDGFLIGYIRGRTDGFHGSTSMKEVFVERFWKDVEGHYDKMRATLLEYCKAEINVPAELESRVKSPESIKNSIERREAARIKAGKQPYSTLEDIRTDVHDLVGIRIIVDFTPHLEDVNNWIKRTFHQDKDPIPFHADRAIGNQWTPWFGAYYCCNHHISVKSETANHLAPYKKVMFEIQVTCLSERLYNKLAHPLLYKGTQGNLSRKDEMVIDMAHAMSLCYSMCLLYFQDVDDPNLISTIKQTVATSEDIDDDERSTELMEQISKNTTFTPNIPLSFLTQGISSKAIKRQDIVSLVDTFRHESTSKDKIWGQMKCIVEEATKEANSPALFLPEVPTARFDNKEVREAPRCHKHTRASIIEKIETWIDSPRLGDTIMWIGAPAGTGKSTLARTIAERCEGRDVLAATYFFRRGAQDSRRNGTARLLTTIASQLIVSIPRFQSSLRQSLERSHIRPEEVDERGLDIQFDTLIKTPLSALSPNRGNPKIVVIDAIDECDEATNVAQLIEKLSTLQGSTRCWLRFLFTSREAGYIRTTFRNIHHQPIMLHEEPQQEVERDIRAYLTYNFARIQAEKHITGKWPQDDDINLVVHRATTPTPLFIYASTLLRYIHNEKGAINTVKNFKNWISQCKKNQSQLGGLYTPILKDALLSSAGDDDEKQDLQKFLASIACAFEPLSANALCSLLCIDLHSIKHWLANLHPVLKIPTNDKKPITIIHESFRDFLLCRDDSEDQLILGADESQLILAEECIKRISGKDPYPPLSFFPNEHQEVEGLDYGVEIDGMYKRYDNYVQYACRNWARHWAKSQRFDSETCKKMGFHLRNATIPWIETMIASGEYEKVVLVDIPLLDNIMTFLPKPHSPPLSRLSADLTKAMLFVQSQEDILNLAPLQTCLSGWIFCPAKYKMKESFCDIQVPFVRNITGDPTEWVPKLSRVFQIYDINDKTRTIRAETRCADSLTNKVLLRLPSGKMKLYDLERGTEKLYHTFDEGLVAIAFHQDCRRVYSVSSQGRVDLYDMESDAGEYQFTLEKCPLLTNVVLSIKRSFLLATSSNVLGGCCGSLVLWNLEDGHFSGELPCRHLPECWVTDIALSPDGTTVAVLFRDYRVALWDVQTRSYLHGMRMYAPIKHICFTPCGSRLLMALQRTLMVWNFNTVGCNMAYLPWNDSGRISTCLNFLQGSHNLLVVDCDFVSVWDYSSLTKFMRSEYRLGDSKDDGGRLIKAMALSPDQTTLATSSANYSLLIWNLDAMTRLFNVPQTGGSIAEAMVFSPDGTMLAVLIDNCVKLWRMCRDSRPVFVSVTQPLPAALEPSKAFPYWNPHVRTRDFLTRISFPSALPSGHRIMTIRRGVLTLSIDTETGIYEPGKWEQDKQTISISREWIQYTDKEGCTRNIIYIPARYNLQTFTSRGGKVVIGDVDGEFSTLDFDLGELEEYSQNVTSRERAKESSETDSDDDSDNDSRSDMVAEPGGDTEHLLDINLEDD
ncbi:hypothetical protein FPOA_09407 [Fusarium poae]|uniref:RelA/SpoT domain-containing protein n=1 Tax=Fusarium poae TaxID=36050 RepID=A0A1B8AB23_FUSPO|nr:hypothetical protein FPOA_09407 [Fusarium poae]